MEMRKTCNLEFCTDSSIIFIIGMPGSGKSTFADRYLADFSVIDIDNIYDETEELLNFNQRSKADQMLLESTFYETLNSRLYFAIKRSLRKNPLTFVIANLTDKSSREDFVKRFSKNFKHCYAIVLDIDKQTVVKQCKNDKYNKGIDFFLSNFDDFKAQVENLSFEEFDIVYMLDKTMVNSVTITAS